MTTVTQPYVYAVADIPGGWSGSSSDHLLSLIETQLAAAQGVVISSDGTDVIITFTQDLTTDQKTILDGLVPHSSDYFIVTSDGGVTDLGNPADVTKVAGLTSATTLTLRYKAGNGTNFNGFGEAVTLIAPLMTIDKLSGNFDANGLFQFTIGAEFNRGVASIEIIADSLPSKTLVATWT